MKTSTRIAKQSDPYDDVRAIGRGKHSNTVETLNTVKLGQKSDIMK
jgi:hypothetical protein